MRKLIAFLSMFTSSLVLAHGEDQLGPNGGYIRMPGAYHTEVLKEEHGFRVYLLDVNWKNPSTKDSNVQAALIIGGKTAELACRKEAKSYFCPYESKAGSLLKGFLEVKSKREGQTGNVVKYELPLKLQTNEHAHGGH